MLSLIADQDVLVAVHGDVSRKLIYYLKSNTLSQETVPYLVEFYFKAQNGSTKF